MNKSALLRFSCCFQQLFPFGPKNLEIVLDSTFTNLKIGQTFAVTGRVQNSGPDIPSGQTIKATVEFVAPDGIAVATHVQTWNGFPEPNNPVLLETIRPIVGYFFNLIGAKQERQLRLVDSSIRRRCCTRNDLSDNTAIHDGFTMDLPDLIVASSSLSTDNPTNTFLPNSVITASGVVRTSGNQEPRKVFFFLLSPVYTEGP